MALQRGAMFTTRSPEKGSPPASVGTLKPMPVSLSLLLSLFFFLFVSVWFCHLFVISVKADSFSKLVKLFT